MKIKTLAAACALATLGSSCASSIEPRLGRGMYERSECQ